MWSRGKKRVLKKNLNLREFIVFIHVKNIRKLIPLKKVGVVMLNSQTNQIMKFYKFSNKLKKFLLKSDIWL